MTAAPPCPECGAALQLVADGQTERQYPGAFHVIGSRIESRVVPASFLACSGCEFCIEVEV